MSELSSKIKNDARLAILQFEAAKTLLNESLSVYYQAVLEDELRNLSKALECSQFCIWEYLGQSYVSFYNSFGEKEVAISSSTNLIGDLKIIVFTSNRYDCFISRTNSTSISITLTMKEKVLNQVVAYKLKITPGELQIDTIRLLFQNIIREFKLKKTIDSIPPESEDIY